MDTIKEVDQWFASWFDTPYYHILYRDRNYDEARKFMERLTTSLSLTPGKEIMDLACGRGRHSFFLNSLGYDVTGVDLSENSIAYAKSKLREATEQLNHLKHDTGIDKLDPTRLRFAVHNMTLPYHKQFDAVFNLFTSFGYFEDEQDNLNTIKAVKNNLKANGHAVIDFMNAHKVINNLVAYNSKTEEGITFHQKRSVKNNHIYKEISFHADGRDYNYTERVHALRLEDFKGYFTKSGLTLKACYGNYQLAPFDLENSDRLIMVLTK